jgi:hypothetical protein
MKMVNKKWLIGTGFAVLALVATMGFTSCASSSPITIFFTTASSLPNAIVGQNYSQSIQADGVTGPPTGTYTYTISAGSFPGLGAGANGTLAFTTVNATDKSGNTTSYVLLSGKPAFAETYTFTVKAQDILKPPTTATQRFTLEVTH